jgi:hypothetical protein
MEVLAALDEFEAKRTGVVPANLADKKKKKNKKR